MLGFDESSAAWPRGRADFSTASRRGLQKFPRRASFCVTLTSGTLVFAKWKDGCQIFEMPHALEPEHVYGLARIMDFSDYEKSYDPLRHQLHTLLEDSSRAPLFPPSEPIRDWPKITRCIRRGPIWCLEIDKPGIKAELRFSTIDNVAGEYEIRHLRGKVDKGNTLSVAVIDNHEMMDSRHTQLKTFPHRFLVTTTSKLNSMKKAWLIGFDGFVQADSLAHEGAP